MRLLISNNYIYIYSVQAKRLYLQCMRVLSKSMDRNKYEDDVECILLSAGQLRSGSLQDDATVRHVVCPVRLNIHTQKHVRTCFFTVSCIRSSHLTITTFYFFFIFPYF